MITIKEIEVADHKIFNQLIKTIDSQSDFMLREAGERQTSDEDQKDFIERIKKNTLCKLFIAWSNHEMVGFLNLSGDHLKKKMHCRYLAMGILTDFTGKKIGGQLMTSALSHCQEQNVVRIELTVVATNLLAINLYKKFGFEIEGTKKKSLTIKGIQVDELSMALVK